MLFCMVINVSIERIGYKPLRNQPRLVPLITALGFSFILQDVGLIWKGAGPQPLPNILPTGTIFHWRGATYAWDDFIVIAVTIPLLVALTYLVRRTRSGKAMRATAQDMDASSMMGINVDRTISFTFALGGALAGAAGAIYALYIGTTKFDLGFRLGLFAFTAAVLGGIGNLSGAVLGGNRSGTHPGIHRRLLGRALDDDCRLQRAHRDPRVPALGHPRRAGAGGAMSGEAGHKRQRRSRPRATMSGWRASWRRYRREHKWLRWAIPLAIIVLAFSYPWWGLEGPLSFIFNDGLGIDNDTLFNMSVYVMLALGLNVVVGYAGLLDLGYVAFFALGAYTLGWFGSGLFVHARHPLPGHERDPPSGHPPVLLGRRHPRGGGRARSRAC